MGFDSITFLLPPSQSRLKGLHRLGFEKDGESELGGRRFLRYLLRKQ
jgi:[ribosomal protein S5]-alanine N-acetyltransferase